MPLLDFQLQSEEWAAQTATHEYTIERIADRRWLAVASSRATTLRHDNDAKEFEDVAGARQWLNDYAHRISGDAQ